MWILQKNIRFYFSTQMNKYYETSYGIFFFFNLYNDHSMFKFNIQIMEKIPMQTSFE